MKYLTLVNTLFLVALCVIGGLALHFCQQSGGANTDSDSAHAVEEAAGEYLVTVLSEGLRGDGDGDNERDDALIKIALDGQSMHPTAVRPLWARIRKHAETKDDLGRITVLTIYLDTLGDAIEVCNDRESFQRLWAVRDEVQNERRECVRQWGKPLQTELEALLGSVQEPGGLAKVVEETSKQKVEPLHNRIELFADLAKPNGIDMPEAINEVAIAVKVEIDSRINELWTEMEKLWRNDTSGKKPVPHKSINRGSNKSKSDKYDHGEYQKLLDRLEKIFKDSNSEAYSFWLNWPVEGEADTTFSSEVVAERLRECAARIGKLQRQRYNLWAMRVIRTASDVPSWHEHLSEIDTGYLHYSVHALYSMTHDRRLNEEQDPHNRQNAVVTLLCKERVPLEAF